MNADGTKYIIHTDGAGHPTVGYGIDIFNSGYATLFEQAGYPTNIGGEVDKDFVDAIEEEIINSNIERMKSATAGLNLQEYQIQALVSRAYNCGPGSLSSSGSSAGAIGIRNGKNFVQAYNAYWDEERDNFFEKQISTANFGHKLYTEYMRSPTTSGGQYMAGLEKRRKSEWTLFQTGYYDILDKWYKEGGNLVAVAYEVADHFLETTVYYAGSSNPDSTNNGRYVVGRNIQGAWDYPIQNPNHYGIVCATFVSLTLWQAGLVDEATINKLEYNYNSCTALKNMLTTSSYANQWQRISSYDELQEGDVVFYPRNEHVYIYVGEGKGIDQSYCVKSSTGKDNRGKLINASKNCFSEAYRYIGK